MLRKSLTSSPGVYPSYRHLPVIGRAFQSILNCVHLSPQPVHPHPRSRIVLIHQYNILPRGPIESTPVASPTALYRIPFSVVLRSSGTIVYTCGGRACGDRGCFGEDQTSLDPNEICQLGCSISRQEAYKPHFYVSDLLGFGVWSLDKDLLIRIYELE